MICESSCTFGRIEGLLEAWGAYGDGKLRLDRMTRPQKSRVRELFDTIPAWYIIDAIANGLPSEGRLLVALVELYAEG